MKLNMVWSVIVVFIFGFSAVAFSQTGASSAQADSGKEVFSHKCVICHGSDGAGSAVGKSLKVADLRSPLVQKKSDTDLSHIISEGKNSMPPFGSDLSADDIKAVLSYVRTLKTKKK
jgi:cytochrome c6